ncbi:MAG: hypothetical protein Q7T55_21380 [Solirubrobacteraceae bacterium]|nr:hypothetical protein [Solirubrobacteraceae bacterium]
MAHAAFRKLAVCALGAVALVTAAAPAAGAHDAPMPLGERHGHLDHQPWVMVHWLPFDEREAEVALGLERGQLAAFLYDDHHTIAQLAVARGIDFETLVARLAAWSDAVPTAVPRTEIEQRIRLVLVSGHLAQHVLGHVFHGSARTTFLADAASLTPAAWARARQRGRSAAELVRRGGGDPVAVEAALREQFLARQADSVSRGETPASQGDRLAARQNEQLHCWLTRPTQRLDAAAPYGRAYLRHAPAHTATDVPATRRAQRVEERAIARGLAGLPASCWPHPAPFTGDPGAPLGRAALRALAKLPVEDALTSPSPTSSHHHVM